MNYLSLIPIAQAVAQLSKDPSTKVGSIIFDDDCNILSVGFNGFPRGVDDRTDRYNNREIKYKFIAHSELNAISQAARKGICLFNSNIIITELYPCNTCAQMIIQAGIKKVIAPKINSNDRWNEANNFAEIMFKESKIKVEFY